MTVYSSFYKQYTIGYATVMDALNKCTKMIGGLKRTPLLSKLCYHNDLKQRHLHFNSQSKGHNLVFT